MWKIVGSPCTKRKIYNVTGFLEEHPGGGEIILPYAGKDVTEIMADIQSHQHSESAYEILDEGMLVGYLATEQEEKGLLRNKTTHRLKLSWSIRMIRILICMSSMTIYQQKKSYPFKLISRKIPRNIVFGFEQTIINAIVD